MLTPNDRPMPRLLPEASDLGVPVATPYVSLSAVTLMSPPPVVLTTAPSPKRASVMPLAQLPANEPATPILPPLAPATAIAPATWIDWVRL